jgi:HPr kinase/phosphorylase
MKERRMADISRNPARGFGNIASADHGGADAGISAAMPQATSFPADIGPDCRVMQMHGSCGSRSGDGVLLIGPPGAGKSDLLLRLLARNFDLVADDQVEIEDGIVRPVAQLAGMLEVRGLGIVRLPYAPSARLALVVELSDAVARMPASARHRTLGVPTIRLDPWLVSAPERVALALDCALGRVSQVAGAFAA